MSRRLSQEDLDKVFAMIGDMLPHAKEVGAGISMYAVMLDDSGKVPPRSWAAASIGDFDRMFCRMSLDIMGLDPKQCPHCILVKSALIAAALVFKEIIDAGESAKGPKSCH